MISAGIGKALIRAGESSAPGFARQVRKSTMHAKRMLKQSNPGALRRVAYADRNRYHVSTVTTLSALRLF